MSLPALHVHKIFSFTLMLFAVLVMVSGCDLASNYMKQDREANLETQDYRDLLAAREVEKDVSDFAKSSKIPALKSYVSPVSTNVKSMPLVSISVNQSVPLRDVLFELAKQADYDIELDPNIRGSIIFTARNRPLDVVVSRIAEVSGLRYSFEDDVLRVEVDSPYHKTYKIDYLNYVRKNEGSIRNNVAVVSGDGADTGSGYTTTVESESDFWGELETNLNQILNSSRASLMTANDPSLVAAAAPTIAGTDDAVLDVSSLPIDEESLAPTAGAASASAGATAVAAGSFAVNRQAGLVSVYGSERAHKEVSAYLIDLRKSMTAQVLIEAKILEVSLTDQFSAGIDWQALQISGGEGVLEFGSAAGTLASAGTLGTDAALANLAVRPGISQAANNNFVVGFLGNDIQALVQAMSGFGNVRALASPRLTVLNNQSAVLNVATNRVFFEIETETETTEVGITRNVEAEIRNVPEGILVNVQPSINLDTQTVSMAVRPTITRIVNTVQDPSVDPDISAPVPELNVQELDSVIQVKSGQPVVMGGLLQDRVVGSREAVPVLGEIPMVGNLFRNQSDSIVKTELVILLKATIMQGNNNIDDTDRDLYRAFAQDRRPFKL